MSNDTHPSLCELVEENIASIIDGEVDPTLLEHIADCDRCRDLRHDAALVLQQMTDAGADYVHPADFEQSVLSKLASRTSGEVLAPAPAQTKTLDMAVPAIVAQPAVPEPTPVPAQTKTLDMPVQPIAAEPAPAPSAPAEEPAPKTQPLPAVEAAAKPIPPEHEKYIPKPAEGSKVESESKPEEDKAPAAVDAKPAGGKPAGDETLGVKLGAAVRGRGVKVVAFGIVSVAALAAAAAIALHLRSRSGSDTVAGAGDPWSGKIVAVSRAASEGKGGLEICNASGASCSDVSVDAKIPAGSLVRTDLRTRAHLELSDGSRVAIERGTELVFAGGKPREAKISRGGLVADVAHLDQGPGARFELPIGRIEVLGTKIAVSASEERSTVEVVRGVVKLSDKSGDSVTVRAGEEGTIEKGRRPEVSPATDMAESVAWSERGDDKGAEELMVRGLGELKARKPGETTERNQAVRLAKHDLKVRVVDAVVRTEIDETFTNDTGDVLEGIYRFPLPPDAQIERLALEVDGKMEEGAFVDKDRAAAIWRGAIQNAAPKSPKPRDEIVWVPGPWRDPALLEWQRGGRFELRIFPIPARGSRRVVLGYTQTVPAVAGVRRYTYPLSYDPSGSTRVGEFNADVQVRGFEPAFGVKSRGYEMKGGDEGDKQVARLSMNAKSFVPSGDLVLEYALAGDKMETTAWAYKPPSGSFANADAGVASDDSTYVAIALRPKLPRWTEGKVRDQVIVVDSSRSMVGERFKRATKLAESVVREMDKQDRVSVMACDSDCRVMPMEKAGPGAATAQRVREFLASIEPEGGSDVVGAIRQARKLGAGSREGRELRIVYIGDGGPTVGPVRPAHVSQEISRVLPEGEGTVTTVAVGSDADSHVLAAMARGGGGVMIPYVPGERATTVAMQVLTAGYGMALRNPTVELPEGLADVYPKQLDTIRAGGETYVVARMTAPEIGGSIKVRGKVGGEKFEQTYPVKIVPTSSEGNAFVPRLYASTKITELEATRGENAKTELVDLSKRFAVASSYTSLLVLESPAMFKAFGLERSATGSPSWSGEVSTESTSADGDKDYASKDEESEKKADKGKRSRAMDMGGDDLSANAYDSPGSGMGLGGGAARSGPSAPKVAAAEADWAAPPAPAATATASPAKRPPATMAREEARRSPRDDWGRRMVPMRKVWDRSATIGVDTSPIKSALSGKMGQLESDFGANPDSKTKLEALLGAYQVQGQLDRVADLATRWAGRDAMDPGAIIARATVAAREGQRARSIRILDGLADLRPADSQMQNWLASMFDAMGDAQRACGHRIALADLRPTDPAAVAAAVRCARSTGSSALADSLMSEVSKDTVRTAIDRELAKSVDTQALKGDVQVDGSWDADADVDIALIGKNGERFSWMGDAKGRVTSRSATSPRAESLAVFNAPAGDYVIEVTRADGEGSAPVRGTLNVRAVGQTRSIPFVLTGRRAEVGSVRITYTPRLVPVSTW
ncbi:MAG: FecR domain-containing protein [Deltaproteobacteria bacterium]|nr:FecR domain-containing protein [Deltaproteobacteria bacterium]